MKYGYQYSYETTTSSVAKPEIPRNELEIPFSHRTLRGQSYPFVSIMLCFNLTKIIV